MLKLMLQYYRKLKAKTSQKNNGGIYLIILSEKALKNFYPDRGLFPVFLLSLGGFAKYIMTKE